MAEKKERWRNRSRKRRELLCLHGVASPSLINHGRVGLVYVRGHTRALQNLMSLRFMKAVELMTCRMPEDTHGMHSVL
jgi:hypothetical protein